MSVNAATIELIKEFEGWRADAYPDPATHGEPWTIGYGHTSAAGGPRVHPGMSISKQEGEDILVKDLRDVEADVRSLVKVPLNENQFGALVSFTFNLGKGNLAESTLLRKLNAKDYTGAAHEFPRWNKAAGHVMAGLTRRRNAEMALFQRPVVATSTPAPVPPKPERADPIPLPAPAKLPWWLALLNAIFGVKS